jgi:hypothetical protein
MTDKTASEVLVWYLEVKSERDIHTVEQFLSVENDAFKRLLPFCLQILSLLRTSQNSSGPLVTDHCFFNFERKRGQAWPSERQIWPAVSFKSFSEIHDSNTTGQTMQGEVVNKHWSWRDFEQMGFVLGALRGRVGWRRIKSFCKCMSWRKYMYLRRFFIIVTSTWEGNAVYRCVCVLQQWNNNLKPSCGVHAAAEKSYNISESECELRKLQQFQSTNDAEDH